MFGDSAAWDGANAQAGMRSIVFKYCCGKTLEK